MESKAGPAVEVKIVDEQKGEVEAVFSTLDVIDKDGDVTRPGAFGDQDVRISAYNHQSWNDVLPVGKGTIAEHGNEAIMRGRFFLGTQAGKDHFETIRELKELMEWSYGFDVLEKADGKWPEGDENGQAVRFLKQLKVHEVSPVILGAGMDTRTLSAKGANKGAIQYQHTGTTDVNWDAGMMTRRVAASQASLRALCAWVDNSGDSSKKTSYKFPHHMVAENGAVGAANTRACSAAIAVLNGGRGGASIPDSDRQGVYAHVAHHIRDANGTPPPLKSWVEYQQARQEQLKELMTSGQISDARTVVGQILALLDPSDPPTVEALDSIIGDLEEACGCGDSDDNMSSLDFTGGVKLFDHLAWLYSEMEEASNRVAKAVAQRAENGQQLSDSTLDVIKMLVSQNERLREAIAIEPRKDSNQQQLAEQIFRDSRALLHLTGGS